MKLIFYTDSRHSSIYSSTSSEQSRFIADDSRQISIADSTCIEEIVDEETADINIRFVL